MRRLRSDVSNQCQNAKAKITDTVYALCRYVDGTFKIVREPFTQMFSIHAFVTKDGELKQLPLAFALMSRRRTKDYKRVLTALIKRLPCRPRVQAVVSDFEAAVWKAVGKVLPGVQHRGCAFHFAQSVWRHVQSVGLQSAYTKDDYVNRLCRQTMSLPFLPADVIPAAFAELKAGDNVLLQKHLDYVRTTWIESTQWQPSTWSVFRQPVRTNNDCEGWHYRLNAKAKHGRLNLYQLVQLLSTEASLVSIQVRLLSEGTTTRLQRSSYTKLHTRLNKYWDEYEDGHRTVTRLLSSCARVIKHA